MIFEQKIIDSLKDLNKFVKYAVHSMVRILINQKMKVKMIISEYEKI